MALKAKKDQIEQAVEALTTRSTGRVVYPNKQNGGGKGGGFTFYPVIVELTDAEPEFDHLIATTTEIYNGKESRKVAMYVLMLDAEDTSQLGDDWQGKIMPMIIARRWTNILLSLIAKKDLPLAVFQGGKLDDDGTIFEAGVFGKGSDINYSFAALKGETLADDYNVKIDAIVGPEMDIDALAEVYTANQYSKAGMPRPGHLSDTAEDTGSMGEGFEA